MKRWFMHLAYRGASFHGWQRQPADVSVQSTIEDALSTLLRTPTAIVGAGRTDTGVNARRMVAHLDLPDDFDPNAHSFLRALNSLCGPDIAIYRFQAVPADAHARFDATSRTYRYFVHTVKDPFCGKQSWQASPRLDFEAMNEAAQVLLGTHDFTSFAKLHTDVKTNICTVTRARWVQTEEHKWYFEITADRFLRNMVRAVTGTLVDVGRGKLDSDGIRRILDLKNRCAAGTSMPAEALFLWDVTYPEYE